MASKKTDLTITITGAQGAGKSTLARWIAAELQRHGWKGIVSDHDCGDVDKTNFKNIAHDSSLRSLQSLGAKAIHIEVLQEGIAVAENREIERLRKALADLSLAANNTLKSRRKSS